MEESKDGSKEEMNGQLYNKALHLCKFVCTYLLLVLCKVMVVVDRLPKRAQRKGVWACMIR